MTDSLPLFAWNQLIALVMAAVVWLLCRTPIVARRPAVCHRLWLLVLVKLVTPPLMPIPVLPTVRANESGVGSHGRQPDADCRMVDMAVRRPRPEQHPGP